MTKVQWKEVLGECILPQVASCEAEMSVLYGSFSGRMWWQASVFASLLYSVHHYGFEVTQV